MTKTSFSFWATLFFILLGLVQSAWSCSGYKITVGDKTIVGCNEDAWRATPHIWFENTGRFGAAFTGSRFDGPHGYAPQAGMNEAGLAFERLASYHPKIYKKSGELAIINPTQYLKDILHKCKDVEEVKTYISEFDYSYFIEDVFMYVDKSGQYLIVEPYKLTLGNDTSYVISNFCPSITSVQQAHHLARYRNGVDLLKQKTDTSLAFCTALSDTMHVCRSKIGDGTLLTTIWDLKEGKVNLYFYHDYKHAVEFDLKEELEKGDHLIPIQNLFPPNNEFKKLENFKTPKNYLPIGIFIVASGGLFLFTSLFFSILWVIRKISNRYGNVQLAMIPLSLLLLNYMYVLSGSINVFYLPAPYKEEGNFLVSMSSYLPFLLLMLTGPFYIINFKLWKGHLWGLFARCLFTFNSLVYFVLIGFFFYWHFYDVF
ncbi:MAG: hypothetical protein IPO65_12580 [Saprospiraceae bacterium]|nr:hypothetical protein [Saprospiraceae bacterium]